MMNKSDILDPMGDLSLQVQDKIVRNAAGKDLVFRESVRRKLDRIRKEVAGAEPSPLECLLADRVALCWLALHDVEIRFASMKDLSIQQAEYWQNRIDRSHRRYLSAIKTLATIRKLALPVLQVNIAKRQTNIVSPCPPIAPEGKQA
jgi:hypothetical protein